MEHLSHSSRLTAVLLGLGMLLLFFFCAPAWGQTPPPAFKSTSPYRVTTPDYTATKVNPNTIGHKAYRSTIYTPFGTGTPSSGNGSDGSGSGGSGDDDDDVGIPNWADTPSEPLPIGNTAPLFLFAAAMIAIIWIKQRRQQQQTQSINTSNNNDNSDSMHTTRHISSNQIQKLFLLLAFVCFVGQVSADKTIYFRPGTRNFSIGYQTKTQAKARTESSTDVVDNSQGIYGDVHWIKNGRFSYKLVGSGKTDIIAAVENTVTRDQLQDGTKSRFIPIVVPTGYTGGYFFRLNAVTDVTYEKWTGVHGNNGVNISNSVPVWTNSTTHYPSAPESLNRDDEKNLIFNREGWWDVYDWGYYIPANTIQLYFANLKGWSNIQMLVGKDIYTFPTPTLSQISKTNLYYIKLAKEYGYEKYGFIGNSSAWNESGNIAATTSNFMAAANTITGYIDDPDITASAWNTKTNANRIDQRIKAATNRTGLRADLLKGINLFIPGNSNDASLTKKKINSWESLNHTQTIKVVGGGKIKYYTHKLSSANGTSKVEGDDKTGTVTFEAAYTANVALRAKPDNGCAFIGFFEEGSSTPLAAVADQENAGQYTYSYSAPNGTPKTITAVFTDKNKVRSQTLIYNESEAKYEWKNSNVGGNISQIRYTNAEGNAVVLTNINNDPNDNDGFVYKYDVHRDEPLTLTAEAKVGYTFIAWWNNTKGSYTDNPWQMIPKNQDESITARFAPSRQQTINVHTYDNEQDTYVLSGNGGYVNIAYTQLTNTVNDGYIPTNTDVTTQGTYTALYNTSITLTATPKSEYAFLGWYEGENKVGSNTTYAYAATTDRNITAHFHKPFTQAFDVQTEIGGQYQNSTTGGTATISYNNTTTDITDQLLTISNMEQGTMVTLNATSKTGYRFVGWYNNSGGLDSSEPEYNYRAEGSRTVHARFAPSNITLSVAVLNYNPEYDKFEEYAYEYNTITLKQGSTKLKESYSSFKYKFENTTSVTLTATPEEGEDGYDFVGWYINNEKLTAKGSNSLYTLASDASTELTLNLSGAVAVNAHFAPKKCYKIELFNNLGGTYVVRYSKNQTFDQAVTKESSLDQSVYTYLPYGGVWMDVPITKPILGYKYKGYKIGGTFRDPDETVNYVNTANTNRFMAHFVRSEDQVVYLHLINYKGNIAKGWENATKENCTYYAFVENSFYYYSTPRKTKWIKMEPIGDYCYRCTIPGGLYDRVNFVQAKETAPDINDNEELYVGYNNNENQHKRSGFVRIPATRHNCYRLGGIYSSTNVNGADAWTTPPTTTGDYRLIYIEQEVASKTEINRTYEFIDGDRIKKIASGTKLDTVSLHIYNKVSKDNNGNLTGTALNNPEIILQQWDGTAWVDVERYMVFGPLKSDNPGVIRMPGRKNTAPVVDLGIDAIKAQKENATKDYGSGVWNFVIQQTINAGNVTAKLLVNETHRYEGTYYIRTPNADGQYNNFTHPGNILSYSEYAKNHSDYSHYFIRYVDIYEDGTPTAEAGKHPVVKFCIANDYAINLCKEFTNTQNRFEPEEDIYVLNAGDLPADATVRFGWDIRTNRLTRAYIANTFHKNNDYLVVDGTSSIGSPQGDDTYFTDNSNHLYSINLPNAKANATAKVKAKMNGKYQYFLGTEQEGASLISGNGENTYPIRLLYDFKDDRFTTIYQPASGTINNDVQLTTPLMIEREHNGKATQIVLNTNKITTVEAGQDQFTQPAYAVMTFLESVLADASKTHHEKMFYWISFPFDVRIKDVFGLGEYGKYWIMEEYNGAQRAQSGLSQSNWKYITTKSTVLSKNVGYVLCLNYSQILQDQLFKSYGSSDQELNGGKLSLYFPSNGTLSPRDITGNQRIDVNLKEHYNANTAWNHHNWHIIGVPSFADPEFTKIQQDAPFVYIYWHPSDAYAAVSINEVDFQSMHAYMVQYTGDIQWTSVVNNGSSVSGGKSLAAKTDEEADEKIMLRLELQQAGSTIDKTYVQLRNDKGTKGFDMSLDLTKIINAGANIYSIVNNHEMAGNAIPKEENIIPLGVVITSAGEYTISMPNGTKGIVVELIDYELGTCTNLLMGDYTVNMPVGTNNTRFALRIVPDKTATNIEGIWGNTDDNIRKLLIDGILYFVIDDAVYNTQGHVIR